MPQSQPQKILITGGAGYIGSILVPMLLKDGYAVRVLDNLMYRQHTLFPNFIDKKFEFIKGDVRNKEVVKKALDGVDYIIHLAGIVGEPACKKDPELCYEVNLNATKLINDLRSENQKIIFGSTGSVYGKVDGICTETTATNPVSDYGLSKLQAESAIKTKPNYIIYRFATGFGLSPRPRLDLMINDFVYRALKQKVNIVYEAHFKRTFIHSVDVGRSFVHAVKNFGKMKNEIYNVGSEEMNFTKEDIAKKIQEFIPYHLHFADFGTDPDQRNYEVSYTKIKNTGFDLSVNLHDGIRELLGGYQALHISNPFSNVD
ncbi:MAG: NAD(P)-dependent oxidoreductase [Candidatus Liptonbacteria bacterium]|nr:NAD(P)-dependent oxidoreductase [Candidatus Liptonbacteria bacterium]